MAAVIAHTSSLIAFHQIGHLSLLERLFVEIHIPPSMAREAAPTLPDLPSWIQVREPQHPLHSETIAIPIAQKPELLGRSTRMASEVWRDVPLRQIASGSRFGGGTPADGAPADGAR